MKYFDIDIATAVYFVSGMGICVLLILLGIVWYHESSDHGYTGAIRKSEQLQDSEMKGRSYEDAIDSSYYQELYKRHPEMFSKYTSDSATYNVAIGYWAGYRPDSTVPIENIGAFKAGLWLHPSRIYLDTTSRYGRRRN